MTIALSIALGLLFIFAAGIILTIRLHPAFGAAQTKERLASYQTKPNHTGRKFTNLYPIKEDFSRKDYQKMIKDMLKGNPNKRPADLLPVKKWTKEEINALDEASTTAIWFGHSALYLKIDGKNVLIDPMFGDYPSPVPYVIGKRFNTDLPIAINDLPEIDLIVLTHDHYDHLDYGSIIQLKNKTKAFLTPSGVGVHLEKWGIAKETITELYWEESTTIEGIKFTSMPTQHFSGRGPGDKMHTLWCSYVIEGQKDKLFFSGDSGYFKGFKKIGELHGPFDICFMECGQYNELWPDFHMFPEETAQAFLDVKGKTLVPIHYGAFALSTHDWDDPIRRLEKAAKLQDIDLKIPQIGEAIKL